MAMEENKIYGSENRRELYENLSKDGFDLGTFEDFDRNMNDENVRKSIHEAAVGAGWDLPDYAQFDRDMAVRRMKIGGQSQEVDHATYDDFIKRHPSGSNRKPATPQPKPQPQPITAAAAPTSTPLSVAPTDEAPDDPVLGTPWGTQGSGTGQSKAYKSFAPGQVRETGDPGASQFGVPYKPDTQLTAAQRDEIYRQNDYAVKQVQKMHDDRVKEQSRRSKPLVDTGNPDVNNSVIKTQGQWEDDLQKGVGKITSFVVPAVDKAITEFDRKADEATKGRQGGIQTYVPGGVDASALFGTKEANEARDPEKILDYLTKQTEDLYKDSSFIEQIGKEADKMGIDRSEYLEQIIKPQIESQLSASLMDKLIKREMPRSDAEYILNGLGNSIVGMIANAITDTKGQREIKNQAAAMTEEGQNPYYNPGTGAKLAQMGVSFAADAPFFGLYGKVSGQVAKQVAEREIQNLIAKGLSEGAARSVVGSALENSVGARMKNYIMQHVISGSLTMGGYNLTSERARQLRDREFDPMRLAGSTAEGLAVGAAFGITGGASQALSQPLSGFSKIGAKAAGFGAEAETMYATEELAKMVQGEEGFTNPFEGSVEALEKLGVMKLSGGHLLESAGKKLIRAKEVGAKQVAGETLAELLGSNKTGVKFTEDEQNYIRNSQEGKNLVEALSNMHPDRAIAEVNGKKKFTKEGEQQRQILAENYDRFMNNPEIPSGVKQKVSQMFGGIYRPGLETGVTINQNEDGSVILKTRDKDGNCVRDLKFDNLDEAEQWRDQFKSQMVRNDAVNMFNSAPMEVQQNIINIIKDQITGKAMIDELQDQNTGMMNDAASMKQNRLRRQLGRINKLQEQISEATKQYEDYGKEGRRMTDEEARNYIQTVIKDGDDAVFNEMYDLIRENTHPADELDTKRNYWEGQQLSTIERHKAQVDAQLAEERLRLQGDAFAEEVIAAADYPDEKMAELAMRASRGQITGDQLKAALDYYNKESKVRGMMDEALKSIDNQVEAANAYVRRNTHADSGTLIDGSYRGRNYYVTAGHFQIAPDGKLVPTDNSGLVILRDKETGEIVTASPNDIQVNGVQDPNRIIEYNDSMEGLRGQLIKEADDSIELRPDTPEVPQEAGEVFMGKDGKRYMVNANLDETGNIVWTKAEVELDENGLPKNVIGNPQPLDIDEYRKAKSDEKDAAEIPPEEDTLAELTEKYGEEKAQQMISQIAESTARALEEVKGRDTSKITDMAELEAYQDEVAAAQKKADYWNGIIRQREAAEAKKQELAKTHIDNMRKAKTLDDLEAAYQAAIKAGVPENELSEVYNAKKAWNNLVNPKEIRNFATDPESQAKWVDEHFDEIVDTYIKAHGNLLDPDKLRDALTPIGYNGKNVPDFKIQGKRLTKAVYDKMLQDAVTSGNRSITLLTGAGGAGKSKATESMDFSDRGIVYDSAFNNVKSLKDAINAAKAAGMTDVQVVAVYNDAATSFGNTIERGLKTGRFLALDYFVREAFMENQGKMAELKQSYPDVDIVCIDNSGNKSTERPDGGRVSVDEAANWDYTVNDAKLNELLDIFENGIDEGRFTEDQIASIGRGLHDVERVIADIKPATIERIGRIERRIRPEDVGDLRPGISREPMQLGGDNVVPTTDGEIQGSSEERPSEGVEGTTGKGASAETRTDEEAGNGGSDTTAPGAAAPTAGAGSLRSRQHGPASGGAGSDSAGGAGVVSGTGNPSGGSETRPGRGSRSSGNDAGGTGERNQGEKGSVTGTEPLEVDQATGRLYQKRVEANIGRTFTFTKPDGGTSVMTIKRIDHTGNTVLTRQDYDANGNAVGEPREVKYHFTRVADAIGKGTWKKHLDADEELRQNYKYHTRKSGDIPIIDVLTDNEKQQLLDALRSGDIEKAGYLEGEFIRNHDKDFVLRGREIRNEKVEKALARSGKGERLRGVREQYRGNDEALSMLEDGAMEPQSIEEYVAEALGDVPKMGKGFLAYTSYDKGDNKIIGLKDETGFGGRSFGGDPKAFNPYLAPKGQGISLKQFAEKIHESLPEGMQQQYSDQDIRNIIHNVMTGAEKPTDIANYILKNRLEEAEASVRRMEDDIIDHMDDDVPVFQKVVSENSFANRLQRANESVNQDPTEGQKKAGNYKKGHISFGGYDFTIENPAGSIRRGTDADGKPWEQKMNNTYGYILGKRGKDGDHLDFFINDKADLDNWDGNVYVVDQIKPDGSFDEHKILYGFDSEAEAREAYLSNYEKGWKGLGKITGVDKATFDKWLDASDYKIKDFADYSIVKHKVEQQMKNFDSALNQLNTRGISIDNQELLDKYGLRNVVLSKTGDHLTLTHFIVDQQGQGYGTRFMEDLARLADEKGWTLALTPGLGFGAKSKKKLEEFYKRFGFVANKGRNADFQTREAMIRRPKEFMEKPENQEKVIRDAVVEYLKSIGIDVSTDWKLGQRILDEHNRRLEANEEPEEQIKSQKATTIDISDGNAMSVDIRKPIEETIPRDPKINEALNIKDRVDNMTPEELIENYKRINSQMLDENGLNVDELEDIRRREYISKHGVDKGFGKAMADHLKMLSDKYGYGKLCLRWDLLDRIKELGLEDYLGDDKPYVTEKDTAKVYDMHGRPKLFKTSDGYAYGYTYKGKIYVDPRIATAETPIHEYDHLWCEMKRQTAPEEWNEIKQVMLNDEVVKPIIDRVKRDYEELTKEGREDDFVEEVITQFSGKRGSERLREVAEEVAKENGGIFGKAEAITAMQRLKSILNRFWEGVAKMMGWKYRNANQIVDRMMSDMLNGVDPTKIMKDAVSGREDVMPQMVGKMGAAEADKAKEETIRMDNNRKAEEMEKAGKDAKVIKFATGWERGADGKWRYEIPDADVDILSKFNDKMAEMKANGVESPEPILKLGELLGEENDLFKYYPKMKDMQVLFSKGLSDGTAGAYGHGTIELNINETNRFDGDDLNNENVYGTLLHEVQHAIQEKEGFALGGNLQTSTTEDGINAIIEKKERQRADIKTRLDANNKILSDPENLKMSAELEGKTEKEVRDQLTETVNQQAAEYDTLGLQIERLRHTKAPSMTDAKDLYHRLAGEVESRNVTERMGMTGEQRRQSLASETEDVPREEQVIIDSKENENNSLKFSRVGSPEPEMTPEERQYWNQWDKAMKKWKEKNAIPDSQTEAPEKPRFQQGESALDYAKKLVQWNREKSLWQTAPKIEDYRKVREDKDLLEAARENEKRYPDSPSAKMRRVAAEFQQIRSAMSRQKAYDKATVKAVTDFAQEFMKLGFGDNLSRGEMERMLSSVKNATGAKDIKKEVDNIMNILIDNHLRQLDQRVQKLSSVKELSKTAQGVEKQGKLELKGQKMIQKFREAREKRMTVDQIRERMAVVSEKMNSNDEEAPMWEQEYEGLSIALQYAENIEGSRQEWEELDQLYKDAVKEYKTSGRSYKAQQEYLESLDQAMQENKIERIGLFGDVIGRLEGNISESMQGAKEFVEREKQRIKHIQDIANYDLAGKSMSAFHQSDWKKRLSNGTAARFFLSPLATFEQMLKQFGGRNARGEGYLYDHFMRSWIDSVDKSFVNEQKAKEELDAKAREVFGGKVKRWSDLYELERRMPTMEVTVNDQGEDKTFTLNQGNLLYIYMADKMTDGRMKLRKMGIDEEHIEAIKDFLDPRIKELGDWIQSEYLPKKRTEYNKVHERMFGAPMAAIDNYFPIKILGDARIQEQDVANMADQDAVLPSTITGSIVKRRKNALPLDILGTDALSLAVEHIEDMERWAAQAEWNKDVNTLLSYTTFRNKVKNMNTIYGSGDQLWNTFADTARMAAGTYRPKAKPGSVDKAISNIAKGVTAAKINFRVYTAFKQILSAPAFLHDVNLGTFVKNSMNPRGSWKWAMENMPVFQKRWKSRQVGDTRLMDDPTDWKMWKNNVVQLATRMGMSPNALVDGVTCAVGARSIYETRYKQYKKIGASDEVARKRALQDAEIGYNLTQQSSEGAFVSAIQKDRTVAANMLSVFRNSSMAYTRQWVDAARNLSHRAQNGYKEDSIRYMAGQLEQRFDLEPEDAKKMAEAEYARAARHDVARLLNMMFGVTTAWNLGASLPYLLFGDDDHTKKEMVEDALIKGLVAGPTEGLAAGNIYSDFIGRTVASEQTRKTVRNEGLGAGIDAALKQGGDYEVNPLPLMADIQGMIKKMGYDKYAAAQDVFNICMQSAVGVNPQTFTDMWNACMDYGNPEWMPFTKDVGNDDLANSKEIALFIMRLMNAPTSSWRNKYIDELGMNVEDAKKLPYEEMARRYANYKHWKDAPIMGWLRDDESRAAKMEKIQKQFDKAVVERMDRLTDEEIASNLMRSGSAEEKKLLTKIAKQRLGVSSNKEGNEKESDQKNKWYQKEYQRLMDYNDIKEDELLNQKLKDYREYDNTDKTRQEVKKRLDWIRDGKYDSENGRKGKHKNPEDDPELVGSGKKQLDPNGDPKQNEAIMKNIRKWRKEALEIIMRGEAVPRD